MYVCKCVDKLLHLFPVFLAKYKEMKGGLRILHSTVCLKKKKKKKIDGEQLL